MAARKKSRRKPARRAAQPRPRAKNGARASEAKAARNPAAGQPDRKRAKPRGERAAPVATKRSAPRTRTKVSQPAREPSAPAKSRAFAASLAVLASRAVRVGVVRHYYPHAGAAEIALEAPLSVGERIHLRGATSDFLASVASLRVAGAPVVRASAGDATLALPQRARPGDAVFALRDPA